jgi:hypothetical protein
MPEPPPTHPIIDPPPTDPPRKAVTARRER